MSLLYYDIFCVHSKWRQTALETFTRQFSSVHQTNQRTESQTRLTVRRGQTLEVSERNGISIAFHANRRVSSFRCYFYCYSIRRKTRLLVVQNNLHRTLFIYTYDCFPYDLSFFLYVLLLQPYVYVFFFFFNRIILLI